MWTIAATTTDAPVATVLLTAKNLPTETVVPAQTARATKQRSNVLPPTAFTTKIWNAVPIISALKDRGQGVLQIPSAIPSEQNTTEF